MSALQSCQAGAQVMIVLILSDSREILEEIRIHPDGEHDHAVASSLSSSLVRVRLHDPTLGNRELLKRALLALADAE